MHSHLEMQRVKHELLVVKLCSHVGETLITGVNDKAKVTEKSYKAS